MRVAFMLLATKAGVPRWVRGGYCYVLHNVCSLDGHMMQVCGTKCSLARLRCVSACCCVACCVPPMLECVYMCTACINQASFGKGVQVCVGGNVVGAVSL